MSYQEPGRIESDEQDLIEARAVSDDAGLGLLRISKDLLGPDDEVLGPDDVAFAIAESKDEQVVLLGRRRRDRVSGLIGTRQARQRKTQGAHALEHAAAAKRVGGIRQSGFSFLRVP